MSMPRPSAISPACRLTAANERVLSRLVSEISQQRRAVDPISMVVNIDL